MKILKITITLIAAMVLFGCGDDKLVDRSAYTIKNGVFYKANSSDLFTGRVGELISRDITQINPLGIIDAEILNFFYYNADDRNAPQFGHEWGMSFVTCEANVKNGVVTQFVCASHDPSKGEFSYSGGFDDNKQLTGPFKYTWIENGKEHNIISVNFNSGLLDGKFVIRDTVTYNIVAQGEFSQGFPVGITRSYYSTGEERSESNFGQNGVRVGEWFMWYPNGNQVRSLVYNEKGQLDGEDLAYWENGNPRHAVPYSNGLKEGEYALYDQNGNITESGWCENDNCTKQSSGNNGYTPPSDEEIERMVQNIVRQNGGGNSRQAAVPVEVVLGSNSYWHTPQVQITAVTDQITITGYQYNRGNCTGTPQQSLPVTLKFGQTLRVEASRCQNLKEVVLQTNQGDFVFTFR